MRKSALISLLASLIGCSKSYIRSSYNKTAQIPGDYKLGIASNNTLSEAVGNELLNYGLPIVERTRIETVLQELKLNSSGVLSQENIKSVGKILNVDALLFVTLDGDSSNPNVVGSASVKIVDVEKGILLTGVNYQNSNYSETKSGRVAKREPLPKTARIIAKSLYKAFRKIERTPRPDSPLQLK